MLNDCALNICIYDFTSYDLILLKSVDISGALLLEVSYEHAIVYPLLHHLTILYISYMYVSLW